MSTTFPLSPNAAALRRTVKTPALPKIGDYPDLALAASVTTAELEVNESSFAAVVACLQTLGRLRLGVNSTLTLTVLAADGPQTMGVLTRRLRVTTAAGTGLIQRLQALGLVKATRNDGHSHDRRSIVVTLTEAGRRVLASVCELTAFGVASRVLLNRAAR